MYTMSSLLWARGRSVFLESKSALDIYRSGGGSIKISWDSVLGNFLRLKLVYL